MLSSVLRIRVLRLRLLEDGDIRVRVLPESEEILVGGAGLGEGGPLLERLALQQFHGDEGLAVAFVDVVNRADVGVVQCACGSGFTLETSE